MSTKYDIAICYRIYPMVSKVPPVYSDDKFKLSELCLKSFAKALEGVNFKLWVLFDGCPEEYTQLFKKYFTGDNVELIELSGEGNASTFRRQTKILLNQEDSDFIYFAEDDYFYMPNAFSEMINFMKNCPSADYVSPYDHPDYNTMDIHRYKKEYINRENTDWKSASTTTMTFLTRKRTLKEDLSTFLTYTKGNFDASIWMSITKMKTMNLPMILKFFMLDRQMFKIMLKTWYFGGKRILFGSKRKLYSPEPSLSTHMDSLYLAPGHDWYKLFREEEPQ